MPGVRWRFKLRPLAVGPAGDNTDDQGLMSICGSVRPLQDDSVGAVGKVELAQERPETRAPRDGDLRAIKARGSGSRDPGRGDEGVFSLALPPGLPDILRTARLPSAVWGLAQAAAMDESVAGQ